MWLNMDSPVFVQSIFSCSRRIFGAYVTLSSSCLIGLILSSTRSGIVSHNNCAPASLNLSCIVSTLSFSSIGILTCCNISPASIFSTIYIIVMPVSFFPSIMAWWIGAPPRYSGSNDAWTLMQPKRGAFKISVGNI